jgi:serine-aspartate repeat-containing protein C/D/E
MNSRRTAFVSVALLLAAAGLRAQIAGTVLTVDAGGSVRSTFTSRNDVYLAVGSPATPCQSFDLFADGLYYYQVTDASGGLLSTTPVAQRSFRVSGGVIQIIAQDGQIVPAPATACGSNVIPLAPFSSAGSGQAAYLVWVTAAASLAGDSTSVPDPACSPADCFHGFRTVSSKVLAFRVEDQRNCQPTFCVSGIKFADANGNGLRDSGENGLPGVEIRVVRTDDPSGAHLELPQGITLTGLTRADGTYRICGLTDSGTYHVSETVPFGYAQTAPIARRLSRRVVARNFAYDVITCDKDYSGLDFGNQLLPNAIGGAKFEDLNANGVRDPGEPGLAGVTINLYPGVSPNPTGASRSTVTDVNGNFIFTNSTPGPFFLTETPPTGFTPTTPSAGFVGGTLTAGGSVLNNVFGNFRGVLTGAISGSKFLDANGNGVKDSGEGGQAGVTITISGPSGFTPQSVVTAADGTFSFTGVPFGTYTVAETVPPGFQQTVPGGSGTLTATLNVSTPTVSALSFGNQAIAAPGSISGTKFLDSNSNGVRDAGENGLAGVTIILHAAGPGTPVMTTTAADGSYSFTGLPANTYTLTEIVPTGYVQTAPAGGTWSITLASGQARTGVDFGNASIGSPTTGSVSGIKYLDLNVNGIFDGTDRPLAGITIVLMDSAGHTQQIVTGDDGTFLFTNLAPGDYVLSEMLPPNFAQTFPGTPLQPQTYSVTVTAGQTAGPFVFLNKC